jgi:hypothetical protein
LHPVQAGPWDAGKGDLTLTDQLHGELKYFWLDRKFKKALGSAFWPGRNRAFGSVCSRFQPVKRRDLGATMLPRMGRLDSFSALALSTFALPTVTYQAQQQNPYSFSTQTNLVIVPTQVTSIVICFLRLWCKSPLQSGCR